MFFIFVIEYIFANTIFSSLQSFIRFYMRVPLQAEETRHPR